MSKSYSFSKFLTCFAALMAMLIIFSAGHNVFSQPLQTGQAMVTSDNQEGYSLRMIDTRMRPPFTIPFTGANWNTPFAFHPSWRYDTLGSVFGLAIDASKYTYLTATSIYQFDVFKAAGTGGVYVIDDATWQSSVFMNTVNAPVWNSNPTMLPNTGPALGNIAYDKYNNQLFVTNFEDGKIYRIQIVPSGTTVVGNISEVFDPLPANNDTQPGYAPRGDRPWGIGVTRNPINNTVSVYYGVWHENSGNPGASNTIGKFDLNLGGSINTASNNPSLITRPDLTGQQYSNPVSDIEFSLDNKRMITAERTMNDVSWGAHNSRVIEYKMDIIGNWVQEPVNKFEVGSYNTKTNSAGGVDYEYFTYDSLRREVSDCDSVVWMTGDAILFPPLSPNYLYGLQGTVASGGDYLSSILIDLDHNLGAQDKFYQGDVDVLRDFICEIAPPADTNCMTIVRDTIYCDSAGTGYYYQFQITNNSTSQSITELEFTVDSPNFPNTVFVSPGFIMPSPAIPPLGTSQVYTIHLTGPGVDTCMEEVCFTLSATLDQQDCPTCCYIQKCIKLPCCEGYCGLITNDSIYCVNGNYYFSFTLTNNSGFTVNKLQLTSPMVGGVTFVPSNITGLTLLNGQTTTHTVQILGGVAGQTYPVRFKLFWGTTECCYFEEMYTLPPCHSDTCSCGQLRYKEYTIGNDTTRRVLECNSGIAVQGGQVFTMLADYMCLPNDTSVCNDIYKITVKDLNTGIVTNTTQTGLLNYGITVNSNYEVSYSIVCGGIECFTCRFTIKRVGAGSTKDTKLLQNYPNPFNPSTQISFLMPLDAKVTIKVYDVTGQLVATLLNNELKTTGLHYVDFDGSNLASGIYFYRLDTEGFSDTKKMLIVK